MNDAATEAGATDAPGVTPLRVLSLWFAFTLSVGLLAGLVVQSVDALDALIGPQHRTVAATGVSLVAAVAVLVRWPGFDTHVAWRVDYGTVLGFWIAVLSRFAETLTGGAVSLWPLSEFWVSLPLGLAVGAIVEYHRHHRGP
jgi:hypothetical protein